MCSFTVSAPIIFARPCPIPSELIVSYCEARPVSGCSEQGEQHRFSKKGHVTEQFCMIPCEFFQLPGAEIRQNLPFLCTNLFEQGLVPSEDAG
jgi:hypothetical protein